MTLVEGSSVQATLYSQSGPGCDPDATVTIRAGDSENLEERSSSGGRRRPAASRRPSRRGRRLPARALVLGITLFCTGCVMIPVTSPEPVRAEGIIDDDTLDSMLGLKVRDIIERIGLPDFAGPREDDYLLVYQGEKVYWTDIHKVWVEDHVRYADIHYRNRPGDKTKVFHCQVIALDDDRVARSYDVIVRPASGISKRDVYDGGSSAVSDCSQVVWSPDERDAVRSRR